MIPASGIDFRGSTQGIGTEGTHWVVLQQALPMQHGAETLSQFVGGQASPIQGGVNQSSPGKAGAILVVGIFGQLVLPGGAVYLPPLVQGFFR